MRTTLLLAGAAILSAGPASAQDLGKAIDRLAAGHAAAAQAQAAIDAEAEALAEHEQRYLAASARVDALKAYVAQLKSTRAAQDQDLRGLEAQLDRVVEVSRQLTPLMQRMLATLERFVELDTPFLLEERKGRIATLRAELEGAELSTAEKFRRLLEAYEVENGYGRTLEAYEGPLVGAEDARLVRYLRIGRLTLVYLALDGSELGVWDAEARTWRALDPSYRPRIEHALRVAREQAPPDLVVVPLIAKEAAR